MIDPAVLDTKLLDAVRDLRQKGRSPKQIARALGARPWVVAAAVRMLAQTAADSSPAPKPELSSCWVNTDWHNQLIVDGHPEWPRGDGIARGCEGLATVLVACERRPGKFSVCSFLVDTQCLGVKETIGPRVMDESELARFKKLIFSDYALSPLAAPIDLAQHLVFGAVDYARGLGFRPAKDFARCTGHLGAWRGESAIRFGRLGKPMYVAGPYDDVRHVMRTLERNVGPDNYDFLVRVAG
ncbi:MAG: helix-turn-helix domain-containing protein [Actinomycetota bacterium]|nr:helix-turn-helix domain-containing protein [Actinomycetota bacterium]MDQ6946743.1 helix-turn-helix domain-containing protein [Actinomycetota bacterium]